MQRSKNENGEKGDVGESECQAFVTGNLERLKYRLNTRGEVLTILYF